MHWTGRFLVGWLALSMWAATSALADPACPDSLALPCPYSSVSVLGTGSPGQLLDPRRVAIGPDQSIYIADTPSASNVYRVVQFDPAGNFVRVVATSANGRTPVDVAVTPNGLVFVLGDTGSGVAVYGPGAAPVATWSLVGAPQGTAPFADAAVRVTAAPDGTLFALFRSRLVEHVD